MTTDTATNPDLLQAAISGLTGPAKSIDPKWFYDARGSALFEDITRLPEYYPTRTETRILRSNIGTLAGHVPEGAALIELGSGASIKTRILLDGLDGLAAYLPVDVSAAFLHETAARLSRLYPDLAIRPIVGDFMAPLDLPQDFGDHPKVGFFPGSTIGNLEPHRAQSLLSAVRHWPGVHAFVVGIDLVKDTGTLIRAYDDAAGVTAAFNLNILERLNREAAAAFDPAKFRHEARWNGDLARIEMHLVSRVDQSVRIGPATAHFRAGDSIHTENSHKYTRTGFASMARLAGWRQASFLTDDQNLFAVAVLLPD